jgi:hypothetical protein
MWRVNTSDTQARQIHVSKKLMDSGGKAERSRGWILRATLDFLGPGFPAADRFGRVCFANLAGLTDVLEGCVTFLAGLRVGFFFGVAIGEPLFRFIRNLGLKTDELKSGMP